MASSGRERILAALDGLEPDRVPLALAFYHLDGSHLAPPGAWRDDMLDIEFVAFPVSDEEEALRRRALPYDGNTRIGNASQAARYAMWQYRSEDPEHGNPLESATLPGRPGAVPVPVDRRTARGGGPRPEGRRAPPGRTRRRRQHATPGRRAVRGGLAAPRPGGVPDRPRGAQGDGPLPPRPARRARPPQRGDAGLGGRGRPGPRRRRGDAGDDDDRPGHVARVLPGPAGGDHRGGPGGRGPTSA